MFAFVNGKASDRQLRVLACLSCRQGWDRLTDQRSRDAVQVAEDFVAGRASGRKLRAAYREAVAARKAARVGAGQEAAWAATLAAQPAYDQSAVDNLRVTAARMTGTLRRRTRQPCDWLRELFGHLFCSGAPDPVWLTWNGGTARKLAETFDAEGVFEGLPVLADALEEA